MIDKDKVIKGLECCINPVPHMCRKCPYKGTPDDYPHCVHSRLQTDALELLKQQKQVEPKTGKWIIRLRHEHYPSGKPYEEDFCSECGKRGSLEYPFCPWCGIKMESDEVK